MSDKLTTDLPNTARAETQPVLLPYQAAWIEDDSQLKVAEKSRRIGLTWGEAADNVLIASSAKSAGGQNVYYIGYNQDMAIEYVEACAMWARAFDQAAGEIEEGFWDDGKDDQHIKTYTIRFPRSGHRIVALSSRPANLRGKQGVVVIDEAAFHDKLGELLKAALALLIWGGRVRVISTHNGQRNPFNDLVNDIRAKKRKGAVHRTTFREALADGLYRRVCLRLGKDWTPEAEETWAEDVYAFYGDDSSEELDVIPAEGTGAWLSRALIEARAEPDIPVLRLRRDDDFRLWPEAMRRADIHDWCEEHLAPLLALLPPDLWVAVGEDFGRRVDLSVIWPLIIQHDLVRRTPFVVELANIPFEQQKQIVFYILDRIPRLMRGAFDAVGNGAYLAEVAVQRYGSRAEEVMLSEGWYREHMPPLKAAFEDAMLIVPRDSQITDDVRSIQLVQGVARLPAARKDGRHGDAAIALSLAHYASRADVVPIEFQSTGQRRLGVGVPVDDYGGGGEQRDAGFGSVGGRLDYGGYQ